MNYNEGEKLVDKHRELVGRSFLTAEKYDLGSIIAILISPPEELAQVYDNWWYDESRNNRRAIAKLKKSYDSFEVYVCATADGGDMYHSKLTDYLKLISKV